MSLMTLRGRGTRRRAARGLSLVELLVGIAVGLIVVAGASFVAVNQLGDNRRLMLETQVQQDLRAAADIVARDLRRAGYWGAAETGAWQGNDPTVAANPYTELDPASAGAAVAQVNFSYSRDLAEDNAVDDDKERFGFKLEGGAIKMLIGGVWQSMTDTNVLEVTRFDITVDRQSVQQACFNECPGGGTSCWPTQDVRRFSVEIDGRAASDAAVRRSVRESVRLRNDTRAGACPA
ncbi:MAG: prepilin-type N-terminal cleavage/methylation domain-containing protein [Burkholderiaceae bacterium]|jgi:type IV pilus assembly protein PilW|nr:prepilin-type N-terminal cleavage/methylation domain-containing protein [Burkholderiaceae bacterium]